MQETQEELLKTEATGSNSRKWMTAYSGLVNRLTYLKNIPKPWTIEQVGYIQGYEEAVKHFSDWATKSNK
jgi:hypothetical protein